MTKVRILSSEHVSGLASPADYVNAVELAYHERGNGAPADPPSVLPYEDESGVFTHYAAVLPDTGVMGGNMYGYRSDGGASSFITPLFDTETGKPLAMIDGASMNPYKTGAAGAVAVDALATSSASVVGIFGSGRQAKAQLRATATVRNLTDVTVFSPTRESRETFATEMNEELSANVEAVDTSEAAVKNSDIIITATNSPTPVFDGALLETGAHVTAMGQYLPEVRELDSTTISRSVYVPDLYERALEKAGAFLQARDDGVVTEEDIHGELGKVLTGDVTGRLSDDEITVFDSGGTAIETVAAANLVYKRAVQEDVGEIVSFSSIK